MTGARFALFALDASRDYGQRVAARLGLSLSPHEERSFEDGEHKARPLLSVRGTDVFVIHALHGDADQTANDKLCRLLFFIGALKDDGAARVTAVVPYLCYARKERRTQEHDPVTSRYVAASFEACGADQVMAIEVHDVAAFENAFRRPTQHLDTAALFAEHFAALPAAGQFVVVSPDTGGAKRAERFRRALERATGQAIDSGFVEKHRGGGVVTGGTLVGQVEGKTAVIIDDLVSTGGTLLRAARACRAASASRVFAAAAHGLFIGGAPELMASCEVERIVVSDTVPSFRLAPDIAQRRLSVLDSTRLVADAIERSRCGG